MTLSTLCIAPKSQRGAWSVMWRSAGHGAVHLAVYQAASRARFTIRLRSLIFSQAKSQEMILKYIICNLYRRSHGMITLMMRESLVGLVCCLYCSPESSRVHVYLVLVHAIRNGTPPPLSKI